MGDIDVVITWVDGNDHEWIKEKNCFAPPVSDENVSVTRYRSWDNLQYIFRGIEKFMPWVRKIHFVTWGHVPEWLNTSYEKLNIVRHEAFIPHKYLPTFNSNAIELNFHRIEGLAEQFIYFNDDMFVVKPTKEKDFFSEGLPCDMACISPQPIYRDSIMNIEINNLKIINDYFSISDIKKHKNKWMKPFLYGQFAARTAVFIHFKSIIGIFETHVPYCFLKSTFEELWEKEGELLDNVCMNKFRTTDDVNIWLMRSWQLLKAEFKPRSRRFGRMFSASDIAGVKKLLNGGMPQRIVCINDDKNVSDFDRAKKLVNDELKLLLPDKSNYEK